MFIFMPADAEARVLHQRQSDAKRAFRVGVTSSGLCDPAPGARFSLYIQSTAHTEVDTKSPGRR